MNILNIHASPRVDGSHSHELAQGFLDKIASHGKPFTLDTINLWEENLPAVDERFLSVKTKVSNGEELTNGDRVLWTQVENLIARIKTADVIVWSIPMWNFGVPYIVKQFIDVVTQYGYLFTINESGYAGLLEGKRALLALSRGGSYTEGSGAEAYDHQEPYMRGILGFWGILDITVARKEFTMGSAEAKAASAEEARKVVEDFAMTLSA